MGNRGDAEPAVSSLVDEFILNSEKYLTPRYTVREFNIEHGNGKIYAGGIELEGQAIAKFLKGSDKCYIMCATIGYEIEREIDKAKGPLAQVIIDAIGTAVVESLCDKVQNSLGNNLKRFSPGYGDLPLSIQPDIIRLLNAEKLVGVRVTDMLILTPRKSVTAIIANKNGCETNKCALCNKDCIYRQNNKND